MNRTSAGAFARRAAHRIAAVALVGALAACGAADPTTPPPGAAGTEPPATTAPTTPACPTPGAVGLAAGEHRLTVDGVERSYLLDLPAETPRDHPLPLIVQLHGHGGSAAQLEERTHLGERGAAGGSAVVTPDALGTPARWNFDRRADGPDDFAYIEALVTALGEQLCVDPDRTFVAGSSNGAAFAGLLACTEPYRFAAVAMVIATVPSGCPDEVTPAVITIRGTADTRVPFDGTPALVAGIADHDGCDPEPVTGSPADGVDRTTYGGCRAGSEVVLDAVVGAPHAWPVDAGAAGDYQATDEILAFFARHDREG